MTRAIAIMLAYWAFVWVTVACAHARWYRLTHPDAPKGRRMAYGASWPARGVRYLASVVFHRRSGCRAEEWKP